MLSSVFIVHIFLQVMVGDSGVGKSCLLEKLLDSTSNNHFISTIGVDVRTISVNHGGETYKLQVGREHNPCWTDRRHLPSPNPSLSFLPAV